MAKPPEDGGPLNPDPEGDRRRVQDIEARLKAARGKVEKPRANSAVSSGMSHRQTGVAYRVMVDMIAGLLVGGFLGYWLDRWLGWTPYGLVGGLLLGFAAGVNNAWRAIRDYSRDAAQGYPTKGTGSDDKDRRLP